MITQQWTTYQPTATGQQKQQLAKTTTEEQPKNYNTMDTYNPATGPKQNTMTKTNNETQSYTPKL